MRVILTIAVVILSLALRSQNLVQNGSFEDKTFCPSNYNLQSLTVIKNWEQLNEGTPDYFNTCASKVGIPENMFGNQPTFQGEGYAGMAVYSPGKRNYREYLNSKLTRPLSAGEMVCIEMRISPADYCRYVVDGFGLLLSKNKPTQERMYCVNEKPTLQNPRLNMLDENDTWLLVSDIYVAKGGEQYVTIGNFNQDRDMKILHRTAEMGAKENNTWAYIYVDEVVVKPVSKKDECSCENEITASLVHDPPLELSEYHNITLDAILFDFDQDVLTDTARVQLEQVYKMLRKNKHMFMVISGHTDIIGNDQYNLELSKRRAERVISELVNRGIAADRLTVEYAGSHKPIADNASDQGRAQNRRVEFSIREKRYELIN